MAQPQGVLTEAGTGGKEARHEASVHDCVPLRQNLGEEDLRHLTKKFAELGTAPGVLARYERLDGMGWFMIEDVSQEDTERSNELTLRYSPWIEMEVFPITTIEEAFPVIQRVYG